ncbi:MAG: hypothetical protein ACE5D1_02520 [Fidelibacterota bacterium]
MFRLFLLAGVIYLGWVWLKKIAGLEVKSRSDPASGSPGKNPYSRMDIQDAEFREMEEDEPDDKG